MKTAEIKLRTTPEFKSRVRKAAAQLNKTISQFMTDAVLAQLTQERNNENQAQKTKAENMHPYLKHTSCL